MIDYTVLTRPVTYLGASLSQLAYLFNGSVLLFALTGQ